MSALVTCKRSRTEEDKDDLPPTKREPAQDSSDSIGCLAGITRTDGQPRGDGQVLTEDEEFWFGDGNVILVAHDIEFRVYRGVLAGLSIVFKDLFAERHALRYVRPDINGVPAIPCPIVHVSDSPEDLRHILRACFPEKPCRRYDKREWSYHEISATIRLGDKYKITELYSQSLEYLKHYYPSTLDSWGQLTNYVPPAWQAFEVIGVMNLARFTGKLSILPSAFVVCLCAESTTSSIAHGITREDGSQECLSPDDLIVCLGGTSSLRMATITMVFRTFNVVVSPECKMLSTCKRALRNVLVNLKDNIHFLMYGDPFVLYEDFVAKKGLGTCPSCTSMVNERNLKERGKVWDSLPELLGIDIPGWRKEASPPPPLSHNET